jgi:hypothetical protein
MAEILPMGKRYDFFRWVLRIFGKTYNADKISRVYGYYEGYNDV